MNFVKRLSLKIKYVYLVVSILVCVGALGLVFYMVSAEQAKKETEFGEVLKLKSRLDYFNSLVAQLRSISQDDYRFFKYGENDLVQKVKLEEDLIQREIVELSKLRIVLDGGFKDKLSDVYSGFDQYGLQVFRFVELIKERGNSETGLVGGVLENSNEIYKLSQKLTTKPEVAAALVRFFHYEKMYFYTGKKEYRDEVVWFIEDVLPKVGSDEDYFPTSFSDKDRLHLDVLLNEAVLQINKLKELENELSVNRDGGTQALIIELSDDLTDRVKMLVDDLKSEVVSSQRVYNRMFLVLFLVLFGLVLFGFWLFFRQQNKFLTEVDATFDSMKEISLVDDSGSVFEEVNELNAKANSIVRDFLTLNSAIDSLIEGKKLGVDLEEASPTLVALDKFIASIQLESSLRKTEETLNSWHIQGQSRIESVFRTHNIDIMELSKSLIKVVVDFLEVNQGALFIFNEQDKLLKLFSSYSFGKHKTIQQEFMLGDGLIGSCARENKPIYVTEIPDDFFSIRSGLGEALPTCVFLVPLFVDNKLYGVLEVASFDKMEKHVRKFLEAISINIASGFARIKISYESEQLAKATHLKSEEMKIREEGLQNELLASKRVIRDMELKLAEMEGKIKRSQSENYRSQANEELLLMEVHKQQELILQLKSKLENKA